jgi:hypothetical protein
MKQPTTSHLDLAINLIFLTRCERLKILHKPDEQDLSSSRLVWGQPKTFIAETNGSSPDWYELVSP